MLLLGRFQLVRNIAICGCVALLFGATTTVKTALAKKPKRPKTDSASAVIPPSQSGATSRPASEWIGVDFSWQPTSESGVQFLAVSPPAALQINTVPGNTVSGGTILGGALQGGALQAGTLLGIPGPSFPVWNLDGAIPSSLPTCQSGCCLGAQTAPCSTPFAQPRFSDWVGAGQGVRPLLSSDLPYYSVIPAAAFQLLPAPSPTPPSTPSSTPIGAWSRSLASVKQELVVGPNSLQATAELNEGGRRFTVHLAADFSETADGLVYGVLTDVRMETSHFDEDSADDVAELVAMQNRLVDQPFSFRMRVVNDALVVKDVKFAGSGLSENEEEYAAVAKIYIAGSYQRSKSATNARP